MKKDTIKKLLLVGLLIMGTGSISGCSSKKKDDAKKKFSFLPVSTKKEIKDIETMSVEETKTLLAGDQIHKMPHAKTLESIGLSYEVLYENEETKDGGTPKTTLISAIEQEADNVKETYDNSAIVNGENIHNVGKYQYVHIIPIEYVLKQDEEATWYKDVENFSGESYLIEIKFEENIEILKAMFGITE